MPLLPFLKKQNVGGSIATQVEVRKPDAPEQEDDSEAPLRACAADMISAVQANDPMAMAEAIKSAFQIMEMQPHDESEQSEEEMS